MIVHLLESTLLLALAILIAQLPRMAARTRYAIVFAALMKFAIPSVIVPRMLAFCGVDLAGMTRGTIAIEALAPLSATTLPVSNASTWPAAALAIWAAVATALFVRSLSRGRKAVRALRTDARIASDGDLANLHRAQARAGVTRSVRLIRSPPAITPSTAGVLHPVIVIPSRSELADDELETILTHECAHIARHDNLLNIIESIAGSALWFHPLVWIARRILDSAREEACDAVVVSSGNANVYITALGKVCGASIAPGIAGISCIVSNTIRERMEAIMSFGTRRTFPHRMITAGVIVFLAAVTIGSGVARALPSTQDNAGPYKIDVTASRIDSLFDFFVIIRNRADDKIVNSSRMRSHPEEWATASLCEGCAYKERGAGSDPDGGHQVVIRAKGHEDGTAIVEIVVDGAAPVIRMIVPKPAHAVRKIEATSDENISIDLKDADIRDVLRTFSKLTNIEIIVDDDVSGRVTQELHEVPWTEAFERLMRMENLRYDRTGNTIYVHRK